MKVTTIGGATVDIFIIPHNTSIETRSDGIKSSSVIVAPNEKVDVKEIVEHIGGGATNTATAFSRLGLATTCFCKIGADDSGKHILSKLKSENICSDFIVTDDTLNTGTSYIVHIPGSEHLIFAYRGTNAHILEDDIPYEALKQNDFLYITSMSQKSSLILPQICSFAHKNNVSIALNPGRSQLSEGAPELKKALKYVDVLILNSNEATELSSSLDTKGSRKLLDSMDLNYFFRQTQSYGVKTTVVTGGANGVHVSNGTHVYFHPSFPTDVLDSVGAGDSFGSVFTASVFMKSPIPEAIQRALLSSQSVIQKLGAKAGLLTSNELNALADKTPLTDLKKTPL